ncbi:MAG TPA: CehA/McbA family metallohydrolase, partial [Chloroflexota bacterium]|nr:CehA/McbA family metallohydrolase [Chloroflexota bacterium]
MEIRAGVAAEDVLERWAADSSDARGAARGAPGTTIPRGAQRYWGVPFACATLDGGTAPGWVVAGGAGPATLALDGQDGAGDTPGRGPGYLVLLHVCSPPAPDGGAGEGGAGADPILATIPPGMARLGRHVGDYVLEYGDGSRHRQALRWRFEISGPDGRERPGAFAARPLSAPVPVEFRGPAPRNAWGRWQTSVGGGGGGGPLCVYALANPFPERALRALRVEAANGHEIAVAALTRWYGREHPLRHERLESFRVTLPPELVRTPQAAEPSGGLAGDAPPPGTLELSYVPAEIDLGVIARKYAVPAFDPDAWLGGAGIGAPLAPLLPGPLPAEPLREIVLDLAASKDATLTVGGRAVPLRGAFEGAGAASPDGAVRVEVLTPHKTWLHVTVEDGATGKPGPSRVHFRAPDGRYLPPYGHRHEVNENWFEDYGADLKLHGTEYAYVDGTFQAELPVGEVYAEVFKGFEFRPLRQKLTIQPGQRELTLRPERPLDWGARGWMTADTHVHFISPQTAWLQGQAEGLNLINLLASQWGDLYTNVGDLSGGLSGVSRDGTLVWVGTENRQHLLGHMSLLGVQGEPVFPMTTAGPSESYLGDPTWTTLAAWADEARRKDGVVVIPHFPNPNAEVAADITLGKIDAVELNMQSWPIHVYEWYRYLNCGYRVAAVGGTDKMSAQMPVGAIRTYARLSPGEPLTFDAWGAAVRAGRTFTTTGPLVELAVEGKGPGEALPLPAGGGSVHVRATA